METLPKTHVDLEANSVNILKSEVENKRVSSVSECCSVEIVDLEAGEVNKVHYLGKSEKDCRICHLGFDDTNEESEHPIELGCSCKDDLAAAHKHCADAWFKIKGDIICEICGSIAVNVASGNEAAVVAEECIGTPSAAATTTTTTPAAGGAAAAAPNQPESRHFWLGHRFLNFLLACMVFAFVISWLFHFNVPS